MAPPTSPDVTGLLVAWSQGDRSALDKLMPIMYQELRRQAASYMRRESPGHTLQTTAVVHETYLRLVDQRQVRFEDRSHFFGVAAQLMRRVLCDHARSQQAAKRGGGATHLTLGQSEGSGDEPIVEILAIDEALTRLTALDQRQGRIVELRYFSGLSIEETAEALGISPATVKREWSSARAWLKVELSKG
jgi:RNA polymerase sigma factor (TIGR02999 family)